MCYKKANEFQQILAYFIFKETSNSSSNATAKDNWIKVKGYHLYVRWRTLWKYHFSWLLCILHLQRCSFKKGTAPNKRTYADICTSAKADCQRKKNHFDVQHSCMCIPIQYVRSYHGQNKKQINNDSMKLWQHFNADKKHHGKIQPLFNKTVEPKPTHLKAASASNLWLENASRKARAARADDADDTTLPRTTPERDWNAETETAEADAARRSRAFAAAPYRNRSFLFCFVVLLTVATLNIF